MRLLKVFAYSAAGLLILFNGFASVAKAQRPGFAGQRVLQRMVSTYARASSYQDSGVVRRGSSDPFIANNQVPFLQNVSWESDTLISFNTYYERPNKFRFEWKPSSQSVGRESVVWSDGTRTYRWMPSVLENGAFEFTDQSDLGFNMDWALSSSLGSIFFVPTLLMKEVTLAPFADTLRAAKQVSIVSEERVDGEMCYVIKADLTGVPWVLWVGEKTFLLRKTRTLYSAKSFHEPNKSPRQSFIAEEVHTNIHINRGVPKNVFRYRPVLNSKDIDLTGEVRRKRHQRQ